MEYLIVKNGLFLCHDRYSDEKEWYDSIDKPFVLKFDTKELAEQAAKQTVLGYDNIIGMTSDEKLSLVSGSPTIKCFEFWAQEQENKIKKENEITELKVKIFKKDEDIKLLKDKLEKLEKEKEDVIKHYKEVFERNKKDLSLNNRNWFDCGGGRFIDLNEVTGINNYLNSYTKEMMFYAISQSSSVTVDSDKLNDLYEKLGINNGK